MRGYIPPEVYKNLNEDQKKMWDNGYVAKLLLATGVPVIRNETVPIICFRINMLNQADVQAKIAAGMPPSEVSIPDVVTPELIGIFINAVIDGEPFKVYDDISFVGRLTGKLAEFNLPADNILSWQMTAGELLNRADKEMSEGA